MELEYEQDLRIDENALDVECLEQPSLLMRYVRIAAKAEKEVSRLKEELGVVAAEIDRDIRLNPASFEITGRVTEDVVKHTMVLQPEYKKVTAELIEAKYEHSMARGAIEAIQERKDMLQELIRLHGQQYFAGPSIPRDLGYEAKQRHRTQTANTTIKITRKK